MRINRIWTSKWRWLFCGLWMNEEWIFQKKRRSIWWGVISCVCASKCCIRCGDLRYFDNIGDLYFHGVDFHLGGGPISNIFCAFRTGPIFISFECRLFSKIMHYGVNLLNLRGVLWMSREWIEWLCSYFPFLFESLYIVILWMILLQQRPGGLKRKEFGHFLSIMKRLYLNVLCSSQML